MARSFVALVLMVFVGVCFAQIATKLGKSRPVLYGILGALPFTSLFVLFALAFFQDREARR